MTDARRDEMLTDIHSTLSVVAARVQDHQSTLYGNGNPGLKADLQRIDQEQQGCPARAAYGEDSRNLRAVWWGILAAFAVGATGVVLQAVAMFRTPTNASVDAAISKRWAAASEAAKVASPGDPQAHERWAAAARAGGRKPAPVP